MRILGLGPQILGWRIVGCVAATWGARWYGLPVDPGDGVERGPALLVDRRFCRGEEGAAAVEARLEAQQAGLCLHLVQVTFSSNRSSAEVEFLETLVAEVPGLQFRILSGAALRGPSCLGFIVPGGKSSCGISYREVLDEAEEGLVAEFTWHEGLPRRYIMGHDWPMVERRRKYGVAFKIINRSPGYQQKVRAAVEEDPRWPRLRAALLRSSGEDDLLGSREVEAAMGALERRLQEQEGLDAAMVEMALPVFLLSLERPGRSPEDDWWTEHLFAVTTFWLMGLARSCTNPSEHTKRRQEIYPLITMTWGQDFALPEHRGWLPGFGYYDAAAVMFRALWPRPSPGAAGAGAGASAPPEDGGLRPCPRSRHPARELLALLRAGGPEAPVPPPPTEVVTRWSTRPRAAAARPWRHGAGPRHGQNTGLRVIIIEEHHNDFQELRALLTRTSVELFRAAAVYRAVLLQIPPLAPAWDSLGAPEIFGDTSTPILHLEGGLEAGRAEVLRWTRSAWWLRDADLVAGCTPLWACVLLAELLPPSGARFLARQNMALLLFFRRWEDLPAFWGLLRSFVTSPNVALAWKHRLGAEQVFEQIGARPAYVPLISLHTEGVKYWPMRPEVLVHRCSHRGFPQFSHLLKAAAAAEQGRVKLEFLRDYQIRKEYLNWAAFTVYRAIVLVPHVPNSGSFADAYAMHIPMFLPAEPEAWSWIWTQSEPFAGPGFPEKRQRAPWSRAEAEGGPEGAAGDVPHPYPAFDHLQETFSMEHFADKAYWFQFTEYHLLPGTRRFRGVADLLRQLQRYGEEDARADSRRIAQAQHEREAAVVGWTVSTCLHLIQGGEAGEAG